MVLWVDPSEMHFQLLRVGAYDSHDHRECVVHCITLNMLVYDKATIIEASYRISTVPVSRWGFLYSKFGRRGWDSNYIRRLWNTQKGER